MTGTSVYLEFFGFGAELRSDVAEAVSYCRDLFAAAVVERARRVHYRLEILCSADGTFKVRDPRIRDAVVRRPDWLPGIVAARLLEAVGNGVEDHYLFHAASVERGGRGLVLAGDSGFGKSTLALGLVMRGSGLLSDEVAVVDARNGRLEPFPKALELAPETAARFGLRASGPSRRSGKQVYDSKSAGGVAVPGAIVFIERDRSDSRIDRRRSVRVSTHERDEGVLEDLVRLEGVTHAGWDDDSPSPVLVLDADPTRLRGWEIEDALGRHGLLVVASTYDAQAPRTFDAAPRLEPLPAHAGVAALLERCRGTRAATGYAERHGGFAGLFLALLDRLEGVRFYRLVPGRLDESLDLLESTLAA